MNDDAVAAGLPATAGYRYSDAVDGQLFVAGQVPQNSDGALVGTGDPEVQAVQCLENLRTLVELRGFAIEDIRHLTVYVVGEHQNLLEAWGAVTTWFSQDVPPATLLGVNLLGHTGQLVEIDAMVVR